MPATPRSRELARLAPVAGLLSLLVLASVAQPVAAQLEETRGIEYIDMTLEEGVLEPEPPGEARTRLQVSLRSSLGTDAQGEAYRPSSVQFTGSVEPTQGNTTSGWGIGFVPQSVSMQVGETRNVTVIVSATMGADPATVRAVINATALVKRRHDSFIRHSEITVIGRVQPRRFASLTLIEPPPTVGPRDVTTTRIRLSNSGFYPDQYNVAVEEAGDLTIATPGTVGLQPRSTREIPITIFGPETHFEYGGMQIVQISATSMSDPSVSFTKAFVVNVSGTYLPPWTFPIWIVLAALIAYGGHRTYQKVKRDRERYGHPGKKLSEDEKEKIDRLEERKPELAEALRAKKEKEHEAKLAAYKERKERAEDQKPREMQKKLRKERRRQDKLRKSAVKKIRKGKDKGRPNREILQSLDPEEREQVQDDLPELLQAASAVGVLAAAQDDEEEGLEGLLAERRKDKATEQRIRLRAEALARIDHELEMGRDPEAIRDGLDVNRRQALGNEDLEAALAGDLDADPEQMIQDLSLMERRAGESYLEDLRKERAKLRRKALKTVKKGKRKDWSRKEILSRLDSDQIHLVGDKLQEMLETHLPVEAELVLLDPARGLSNKENKRRKKLQDKLHKRRMKVMDKAASKIEKMHEKGRTRHEILDELTSAQRWAAGDLLDTLMSPLPVAIGGLRAYLEDEDLDEDDRELWQTHLDKLRARKHKFAKKGLKRVRKLQRKGSDPEEIVAELPEIEREALHEVLGAILQPTLTGQIDGIEAFLADHEISEDETELWESEVSDLRDRREELRDEAVEKIKDLKAEGAPPEAIGERLTPAERDAVGKPVERMVQATLPEDVDVIRELMRDEKDPKAVRKAKKRAQKVRAEVREDAVAKVDKLLSGGGLLGGDPKEPREVLEELAHYERVVLGDALEVLFEPDLVSEIEALEAHLDGGDLSEAERALWEERLEDLRAKREAIRDDAIKKLRKAKKKDTEPDEIVEEITEDEHAVLGDAFKRLVAAPLPEDVELIDHMTRPDRDPDAIRDAKDDAHKARAKARKKAARKLKKALDKGVAPEAAMADLPYSHRRLLKDTDASVEEILQQDSGGLLSFGGSGDDEAREDEDDEGSSGGLLGGLSGKVDETSRKERAKELLEQGRSPAEVKRILDEEDRSGPADAEETGTKAEGSSGGLLGRLTGGKEPDEGAWKKDLARKLLAAGVPKEEVPALLRKAADEIGDLSGRARRKAIASFVEDHAGEGNR